MFEQDESDPRYCHPIDNKVNNYQAVKWIEKLCKETSSSIVISSSWRFSSNYKECLYNGGLSRDIEILGKTPRLHGHDRGNEIQKWLDDNTHLGIEQFVIIDDDNDMAHLMDRLIRCDTRLGFDIGEYNEAKKLMGFFSPLKRD